MAAGMLGADTDELRRIAGTFGRSADGVDATRATTGREIDAVDWIGPDRDAFVERWATTVGPRLIELRGELERIGGAELPAQADAQDEASGAGGSGGGSGPSRTEELVLPGLGDLDDLRDRVEKLLHKNTDVDAESRHREEPGPLDTEVDDIDPYDVNQRGIGDCWALASVAAVAQTDPEFLAEHIVYDDETNEYIVTLYDEQGNPVDVRIDNSYVERVDGDGLLGVVGDDGEPNYASIYEKALAEHFGGEYGDIWGGKAEQGLEAITGRPAETVDIAEGSSNRETSDAIRAQHDAGEPVALATRHDLGDDVPMVGGHVYVVTDVMPNGDVVVYNPWGGNPDSSMTAHEGLEDGEVVIPRDELDTFFYERTSTG